MNRAKKSVQLLEGSIFLNMTRFMIPLLLSGLLQLLYNAVDIAVVGRFDGSAAMAAVGSTSSLIHLLVNVFLGLSVGTNVVTARAMGAGDTTTVHQAAHTSIAVGGLFGLLLAAVGIFFSETFLTWMDTPLNVLPDATLYMQIYFAGMPFGLVYNFAAALLRSAGDTRRPLYFLALSGAVNVALNLLFVILFRKGVAGVALATSLSQALAMVLALRSLTRRDDSLKLSLNKVRLHKGPFWQILKIGVPAGAQSAMFSLANVVVQSAINSFQSIVMAGNTAAANLESFVYTATGAVYQACITFTGQNMGAKNTKRVKDIYWCGMALITLISLMLGGILYLAGRPLLAIYNSDPAVIDAGMVRLTTIALWYCACGWMDATAGQLRGMGYSLEPTLITLAGSCGLRILWVYTVFAANPSLEVLYGCFPTTWMVTFICQCVFYYAVRNKKFRELGDA